MGIRILFSPALPLSSRVAAKRRIEGSPARKLRLCPPALLFLCLLWTVPAYAVDTLQVTSPDPLLEPWRWTEFSTSSGLAGNVWDMLEDRDGNIWFATDKGAQKYDGYRWTTYTREDGLVDDFVASIIQTRDGTMWFSSLTQDIDESAGISRMVVSAETGEPEWSSYTFEGFKRATLFEAQDGTVWAILGGRDSTALDKRRFLNGKWEIVDSPYRTLNIPPGVTAQTLDGSIWFSALGGVVRFDGVGWTFVGPENGMEGAVESQNKVFADQDGNLWVSHNGGGLSRFDGTGWVQYPLRDAAGMWQTADGIIWHASTRMGISRFRSGRWHTVPYSNVPVTGLVGVVNGLQTTDGSLWLFPFNAPRAYRLKLQAMTTSYQHTDSLRVGPEGLDGAMWFHTRTSAVRLKDDHWVGYGPVDGFLEGTVARMGRSADGSIWAIGSHLGQGAAARFSSGKWKVFTEADGVIDDPRSMMMTRDGGVWVKGSHQRKSALSHFDPNEPDGLKRVTSELTGVNINYSYEASDGTLWFGSDLTGGNFGAGLYRYDGSSWMHFTEDDGFIAGLPKPGSLDGRISGFAEWPTGTLWVGTAEGLYRIDLNRLPEERVWWRRMGADFDILFPKFSNLTPTDNALWFRPFWLRSKGAIRYDGKTWRTFTTSDGLPDAGVSELFRTSDGAIWFRGRSGLSRLGSRQGGQENGFTRFRAAAPTRYQSVTESRDGSLWMNDEKGVTRVRYREIEPPDTFLEPATASSVASDGTILLKWLGRTQWDATPVNDLTYEWRIDDGDWVETGNTIASFAGLDPGEHRFEVRTSAPTMLTDPTPASHLFIVAVPWWRNPVVAGPGLLLIFAVLFQSARVVRGKQRLQESVNALSDANNELFQVNRDLESVNVDLQREQVLERLSGQAQGMQSSEDIKPVVEAVFRELTGLGLPLINSGLSIDLSETKIERWIVGEDGRALEPFIIERSAGSTVLEDRSRGDDYSHRHVEGEGAKELIQQAIERGNPRWKGVPEERWPQKVDMYTVFFEGGAVVVSSEEPISEEYLMLIKRFAEVFGYAHSRYKELQQKEAQNKRLTVEASLEHVRARALGMQESADIGDVAKVLFGEMVNLGFDATRSAITTNDSATGTTTNWWGGQIGGVPGGRATTRLLENPG